MKREKTAEKKIEERILTGSSRGVGAVGDKEEEENYRQVTHENGRKMQRKRTLEGLP